MDIVARDVVVVFGTVQELHTFERLLSGRPGTQMFYFNNTADASQYLEERGGGVDLLLMNDQVPPTQGADIAPTTFFGWALRLTYPDLVIVASVQCPERIAVFQALGMHAYLAE